MIPAKVPGCVHTDLLQAGLIDDPFYRRQELDVQWVGERNWSYTREFTVPAEMLTRQRVLLHCDGLDTFARVLLNDTLIGVCDNMFRTWEFDVTTVLRSGVNQLSVQFDSPLPYMAQQHAMQPLATSLNAPHERPGRSYVRKMPCGFGWDWGPALVTCGIWRSLELRAFDVARLRNVSIQQDHRGTDVVVLQVEVEAEELAPRSMCTAAITVSLLGSVVAETCIPIGADGASAQLTITNPQLWWPRGMGEQPLYQVQVRLLDADGIECDQWVRRIGLRSLRLDRHADAWGESFQFIANGIPFFAKGGNWIPADAFVTRVTPDTYRALLQSCADANMNMLRVWGGGIYEDDLFYDLCDELGICVWQEFIFACASYPAWDPAFLANVQHETEDNVRRLRHHASLALWCGNNELEMCGYVREDTDSQDRMRWTDYRTLFDTLLPDVVTRLDPEHDYWPSSSHTPGEHRSDPNDPTRGDAHLWDVWFGRKPFEWYRTCTHRFNSEFGFQSFPEPLTTHGYTNEEERNVTTLVMEHHQRSGIGNAVIMQYMLDWFRLPFSFDMTLWLSQILQGMAMKYAVEHWRRSMPRGMGTLYWQVNDNWPTASWSSLDYHGRWKALHYMAKQFFAPVLVSGVEDLATNTVEVHLTNDQPAPTTGEIAWKLLLPDGEMVASGQITASIAAGSTDRVAMLELSEYLSTSQGAQQWLLDLSYLVDGEPVSTNLVTNCRPKHLALPHPEITLQVEPQDASHCVVTLTAAHPALWTWLAMEGVALRSSDNYFHLFPHRPVRISLTASQALTAEQWETQLQVYSLIDTYQPMRTTSRSAHTPLMAQVD